MAHPSRLCNDPNYIIVVAPPETFQRRSSRAQSRDLHLMARAPRPSRSTRLQYPMLRVVLLLILTAFAQPQEKPAMPQHAIGPFDVKITPQQPDSDVAKAANL